MAAKKAPLGPLEARPGDRTAIRVSRLLIANHLNEMPDFEPYREPEAPARLVNQVGKIAQTVWISGTMIFKSAGGGLASSPTSDRTLVSNEIEAQIAAVEEGHELAFRVVLDLNSLLVYLPRKNWNDIATAIRTGLTRSLSMVLATDALRRDDDPVLYVGENDDIIGRCCYVGWEEGGEGSPMSDPAPAYSMAALWRAPLPTWVWSIMGLFVVAVIAGWFAGR